MSSLWGTVGLSPTVDFIDDCESVGHSEPLSCCDTGTIVAVCTVVIEVNIGDDDIPSIYLGPAVVLADNKCVALDASLIALVMQPLSCIDVIIGKVDSLGGLAVGGDKCVVYAQCQSVGFVSLSHNYYSFIINSVHLLSCSIRGSPISPNHPKYGSAHGRLIPAVYSLFFCGDTLLGVCVRISGGHLQYSTSYFSCQQLFSSFCNFFFLLSLGRCASSTVCILADRNKENNNILVNIWLQFGYNIFSTLVGGVLTSCRHCPPDADNRLCVYTRGGYSGK